MNKERLTAIILMFIVAALTFSGIVFLARLPPFKPQYVQIASAARLMIQICIGILGLYSIKGIFRYMKRVNMEQANYIYVDFAEKEMPGEQNRLSGMKQADNKSDESDEKTGANEMVRCHDCRHVIPKKQKKCFYCGSEKIKELSYDLHDPVPCSECLPNGDPDDQPLPEETPAQPRTIFGKIFYSDPQEQSDIRELIIGFAIAGMICGHMWGGFYDPWRNRGLAAALLNLFLFGGWGLVQSVAMLAARNLGLAKTRKMLIFIAALCGGVWISIFSTLDLAKDLVKWEPVFFRSVVGLTAGFITGAGISAISVIKLSRIISAHEKNIR